MKQQFKWELDPAVVTALNKGPVDVDACLQIIYHSAMNPGIKISELPAGMLHKCIKHISHELANFSDNWRIGVKTYKNPQHAMEAIATHKAFLITVYNQLHTMQMTCGCAECAMKASNQGYGARFTAN